MKLLFCLKCQDIFKLDVSLRQCKCGKVSGRYIDSKYAETNGRGFSLAIDNYSLADALGDTAETSDIRCWLRPNEGSQNPHTKIVGDLMSKCKCKTKGKGKCKCQK